MTLEEQFEDAEAKRLNAERQRLAYLQTQTEYFKVHGEAEELLASNTRHLQENIARFKDVFSQQQELSQLLILMDKELLEREKELASKLKEVKG